MQAPKGRVGCNIPKSKNPTPAPQTTLPSARSLSKLNDITTDRQQLTYRATDRPQQSGYPGNQAAGYPLQSTGMSHSFSSPILSQLGGTGSQDNYQQGNNMTEQFGYMDAIEALHRRHLAEKNMVANVRNKI